MKCNAYVRRSELLLLIMSCGFDSTLFIVTVAYKLRTQKVVVLFPSSFSLSWATGYELNLT